MMKPLDGVTVLDLGMVMQAPLAAQMLGDYGAEVIKIERPVQGDIMRDLDRVGSAQGGMSCYYAAVGRNKRTLCLDIKRPEGRDVLLRLIDRADVLIHNFRPGVMERLGLAYDQVKERNPRLVYAVAYAFGERGPMAAMPGQDMLAQAFSGFALNGVGDGDPPRLTATPVADYASAASLAQGILAALFERERSGRGQQVSLSLFDVALAMQTLEIASRAMYRYRSNWLQYSMLFRTRDGWLLVLTLFRDNPLQLLCRAFGVEDMSQDPELADADLQVRNLAKIQATFGKVVAAFTTAECVRKLDGIDILCAPVLDLDETVDHPQTRGNGILWQVPVPGHGEVALAGNPVRLSRTSPGVRRGPGGLGEHSAEVLADFAFSADEIDALIRTGVVRSGAD